MSLEEYYQWMDFSSEEPFLSERVDLVGAQISSMMYNMNRGKSAPHRDITEFMLIRNAQERNRGSEDSDARETRHLQMFILSMGGKVS